MPGADSEPASVNLPSEVPVAQPGEFLERGVGKSWRRVFGRDCGSAGNKHALLEMQRIHDGGAALHAAQPPALCAVLELRVLVGPGRPAPVLS